MSKEITISITLSEGDVETLEVLRERYGRDDLTGILEHILNEYYDRSDLLEGQNSCTHQ